MRLFTLTQDPSGRYIIRLNASLLKEADCLRKVLYRAFYGLSKPSDTWKADYGTACHKALEYWYGAKALTGLDTREFARKCGMNFFSGIFVPDDDWRTVAHLSSTLNSYFQEYANDELVAEVDKDGKPILERTFEIKYYEDSFCVIYLMGTIDMKATWQGRRVLVDHKTTGFWKNTGKPDDYLDGFITSLQMSLYLWADEQETGERLDQFLVNGIFLKKPTKTGEGTFFERRLIEVPDKVRETNMNYIRSKVDLLVDLLKELVSHGENNFPSNFTRCEGLYGHCEFKQLCLSNNSAHEADLISSQYLKEVYDPRKNKEEV